MRRRPLSLLLLLLLACPAAAQARPLPESGEPVPGESAEPTSSVPGESPAATRAPAGPKPRPVSKSRSLGHPTRGRLVRGVPMPLESEYHLTWDPILKQVPNRLWRRWGTDRTVARTQRVLYDFHAANPDAPPVLVGDLSRRRGGDFSARVGGGLGHASHQNGLDVDVYYPRRDRRLRAPIRADQVHHAWAQELVDRFVDAGAIYVFVGPRLNLRLRPRGVVQPLVHHDDHLHVRFGP